MREPEGAGASVVLGQLKYLSICVSMRLSDIYLSVYLFVCLYEYINMCSYIHINFVYLLINE